MQKNFSFIALLAGLSALSGVLLSKASWIGRVGMTFFYKEYNILKIWWQGGTAVFLFIMLLFTLHQLIHNRLPVVAARVVHFILLLLAGTILYLNWVDFTETTAHRILGSRFHYGFYLVWVQWILVCIFFLFKKKNVALGAIKQDKTEPAAR